MASFSTDGLLHFFEIKGLVDTPFKRGHLDLKMVF